MKKKSQKEEDYYLDKQGFVVLTEAFLLRRGFCCGSGCRHCPYKDKKEKNVIL